MKEFIIMLGLITCLSCSKDQNSRLSDNRSVENLSNNVILKWNEVAYQAFGGEAYQHSLMASRINAMTHIAMHDAINAIHPVYSTYEFKGKDEKADLIAAAANAAYTVLVNEIPEKKQYLDSALQQTLTAITDEEAKRRGILLGHDAGMTIIKSRANDGSAENPFGAVTPSVTPGTYQIVPPFDFVFAPNWVNVKPFGLQKNEQFRSVPPPAINSNEYTKDFNEVKETGSINTLLRTDDQTNCANFWYEFSEAGWNRVAKIIAVNKNLNLFETARLFALVDMAMADAYLAGWDSKFYYNCWRPYTAIRNAKLDGNDYTIEDLQWEPVMPTPPVQDYPSTHSALGNAAATVIEKILGENTSFTMSSPTALPSNESRSFANVRQAADENADSRVRAGIHFRFACEAGQEMGDKIGQWMVDNYLKPLE